MAPNICAQGSAFAAAEKRPTPKLHLFPVSLNSQKAHLFIRLSSTWSTSEVNFIDFPQENQTLAYCRLNPNMTVPVLEIDDQIITDSVKLGEYLREHYPGPGDKQAPQQKADAFIQLLSQWDEGLFTYRRLGSGGVAMNELRFLRMRQALEQAISEGCENEVLRDGRTITDVYAAKLGQFMLLQEVVTQDSPDTDKRIASNDSIMRRFFIEADGLISETEGPYLFGKDLSMADAFFIAILFRMGDTDHELQQAYFKVFPSVAAMWNAFTQAPESEVILPFTASWAKKKAFGNGLLGKFAGLKMGLLKPPALPEPIEKRIVEEFEKAKAAYFA
eukprot:CAMPEP_0198506066 /NCGR_PEP_ID=MMETSP1462-20131121/11434_1 /TAXON_ID=1333877 /ORGANISM="Brandtodinium nutriculum, Strain RCC3387" /LENGTH=331 /DNA_ID=CAMNT_0044235271 /DNA_START=62 /DNA_END=1057 /DNA_ORIENTATION=-